MRSSTRAPSRARWALGASSTSQLMLPVAMGVGIAAPGVWARAASCQLGAALQE
ncbi:MAG TPA: hypothetical protein VIU87_10625 [Mycobacterium sp.]